MSATITPFRDFIARRFPGDVTRLDTSLGPKVGDRVLVTGFGPAIVVAITDGVTSRTRRRWLVEHQGGAGRRFASADEIAHIETPPSLTPCR